MAGFIGSPAMNFFEGVVENRNAMTFAEKESGIRLPIWKKDQLLLKGYVGKELVLGLRPEQISYTSDGRAGKARTISRVIVEVVEPMGNETYIYFSTRKEGHPFVARVASGKEPAVGKPLDLAFDMGCAHFFDRQTEKSLR